MKYITTIGEHESLVEIVNDGHIIVDGKPYRVDFKVVSEEPVFSLLVDGNSYESYVYPSDEGWQVLLHGYLYLVNVEDERERRLRAASGGRVADRGEYLLKAPMPGLVVAIMVEEGQEVDEWDVLVILESMKMKN